MEGGGAYGSHGERGGDGGWVMLVLDPTCGGGGLRLTSNVICGVRLAVKCNWRGGDILSSALTSAAT